MFSVFVSFDSSDSFSFLLLSSQKNRAYLRSSGKVSPGFVILTPDRRSPGSPLTAYRDRVDTFVVVTVFVVGVIVVIDVSFPMFAFVFDLSFVFLLIYEGGLFILC